ncbi:WD40 repeat-like protein [Rhizopogon salebrosus TDB-379]|nr:WD40 repeat-like protein [Rhizopogon salebrosus TDB-379]
MEPSLSPIRSLRGHARLVQEVVFSKYKNHLRVISTSNDATVRIWDVETGNQVGSPLEGYGSANVGLAVSIDGRRIVSGAEDGKIIIWDADTKDIINVLSHHTRRVDSVQFSPDEKRLASASYDGTLKIWDVETGELVCDIDDHSGRLRTVAYSPNGIKIASGSADCTVRIWSSATGKQQTQPLVHDSEDGVSLVVWSPDSRLLLSACVDGQIYFWSAPTGAQLGSPLRAHSDALNSLAISPNGELIASASNDGTARLWSTATRRPFGRVLQHADKVYTVAFSPDSQLVATGGNERVIFLWDISQEAIVATHAVSPIFVASASVHTSDYDQAFESVTSISHPPSPTPALHELQGEGRFPPQRALPPPGHSHGHPEIPVASSSAPALASSRTSFWKRFPVFSKSSASVGTLKRWKFPNIMRRKRQNMSPQAAPDAQSTSQS